MAEVDLILASASPRRQQLIKSIGLKAEVFITDIDETPLDNELPPNYVERLAIEKGLYAQKNCAQLKSHPDLVILAADTIVAVDGHLLQKPIDDDDAKSMLMQLSGRTHDVYSGVAVIKKEQVESRVQRNKVRFMALNDAFIDWYITTGEPSDKAGAYAIQGKGGVMIEHIEGSFTGVMGLPLHETYTLLASVGVWPK